MTRARSALDAKIAESKLPKLELLEIRILVMTYFAECEAEEIARAMAMSLGSVRVARHRALAQLHECITQGEVCT